MWADAHEAKARRRTLTEEIAAKLLKLKPPLRRYVSRREGSKGATSERGKESGEGLSAGPPNGRPVPEVAGMSMGTRYRKVQLTGTVGLRPYPKTGSISTSSSCRT